MKETPKITLKDTPYNSNDKLGAINILNNIINELILKKGKLEHRVIDYLFPCIFHALDDSKPIIIIYALKCFQNMINYVDIEILSQWRNILYEVIIELLEFADEYIWKTLYPITIEMLIKLYNVIIWFDVI